MTLAAGMVLRFGLALAPPPVLCRGVLWLEVHCERVSNSSIVITVRFVCSLLWVDSERTGLAKGRVVLPRTCLLLFLSCLLETVSWGWGLDLQRSRVSMDCDSKALISNSFRIAFFEFCDTMYLLLLLEQRDTEILGVAKETLERRV